MNLERVSQIAQAVLYEGYMLYPYRPSSVKNRQRWNFGVVYPPSFADADGNDRGGVRLVELEVPLGTHTGWNERAPETGFPWATASFDGTSIEKPGACSPSRSVVSKTTMRVESGLMVTVVAGPLIRSQSDNYYVKII